MTANVAEDQVKFGIGIVGGGLSYLFGGFDELLLALFIFMTIDFCLGFISACVFKISKYSEDGVSSQAILKGLIRKLVMLLVVCIAVVVDNILNTQSAIRYAAIMYLIGSEGLSILEHMIKMDVPFPQRMKEILNYVMDIGDNNLNLKKGNKKDE